MIDKENFTIAIAGNPNCGKTALFNALTGSNQEVGNWPGVTVEKKEGFFQLDNHKIRVVDLPGIYALSANSEDERVALDFLLSREADLIINILDATNLERNLFLTTQLMELDIPMVIAVNMMDIAVRRGIQVYLKKMTELLGITAVGLSAISEKSCEGFVNDMHDILHGVRPTPVPITHSASIENLVKELSPKFDSLSKKLNVSSRWVAIQYLEHSGRIIDLVEEEGISISRELIEESLGEEPEFAIADSRYTLIRQVAVSVVRDRTKKETNTDKIDRVFLHRIFGLPLFVLAMYLVFWIAVTFGGAFIDFFDIFFGAFFVDGFASVLQSIGVSDVWIAFLADGLGTGIQTVATFIPVIFFMFLCLAFLEDSGYMARAAFVADRFMRILGLPGKAFVPMLVGFGCSVSALMATRTMENKRERFLTLFLVPFMSCSARLPVYALFGAAFFGAKAGMMIFAIYFTGILVAIFYGLLLRKTLFQGQETSFIMELPPYHFPRFGKLCRLAWYRLREFLFRAGKVVLLMVTFLGFLGSIGTDGSFGNQDSKQSVLSVVGREITPVFEPFGVEKDNWPASVALFTGLFAKEAIVGTLNSLYSISDNKNSESEETFDLGESIKEAFISIPVNMKGVFCDFLSPFSLGGAVDESASEENRGVINQMKKHFTLGTAQVFSYLLFILLYVPCLAALGTAYRELGRFYATLMIVFQTILGWCLSVLFFQIMTGHQLFWIIVALILLLLESLSLFWIGKKNKI
ncbi:MAG TPA: ferrous iron transport protein B [Fibrobacteraceae bacterium]|nr:ferrous iron transport protein B [Fibrobacteraceae bacterium]